MTETIFHLGDTVRFKQTPDSSVRHRRQDVPWEVSGFGLAVLRRFDPRPGIYQDLSSVLLNGAGANSRQPVRSAELELVGRMAGSPEPEVTLRHGQLLSSFNDLPETSFTEGDLVTRRLWPYTPFYLVDVDYMGLLKEGDSYPAYGVSAFFAPFVPQRWLPASHLRLRHKGPLHEGVTPPSQEIAAMLAVARGDIAKVAVQNSTQARQGIAEGSIHTYGPLRTGDIDAYRFNDAGLGVFVARRTMEAFHNGSLGSQTEQTMNMSNGSFEHGGGPFAEDVARVIGLQSVLGPVIR